MAKGKKTGGKDFAAGVSGNPNGRPPVPEDIREARDLDQQEFDRVARMLMKKSKTELTAILKDPTLPATVLCIARIVRTAMWSADPKRLGFLMDRLVGRPRSQEPPPKEDPTKKYDHWTNEQLDAQIAKLRGSRRGNA